MNWFYKNEGKEFGPLTEETIRELCSCGAVTSENLVRPEISGEWTSCQEAFSQGADLRQVSPPALESIKFDCVHCGQSISAELSDAGLEVNCPSCGGDIEVPREPVTSNFDQRGESGAVEAPPRHPIMDSFKAALVKARERLPEKEARDRLLTQAKIDAKKAKGRIEQSEIGHKVANWSKVSWARLREPAYPEAEDYSIRSAVPLFVCCLGFGWVMTLLIPMRFFPAELSFASVAGVVSLAVPSVAIAFLGMTRFLGYPRREWGKLVGALLFTMFAGIAILLFFHRVADASQTIDTRYYGKFTPFILGTKLIGWLEPYRFEGNFFLRLLASIFHTGFCEEVTKLLPLFLVVLLNRKRSELPRLRSFLMIAFFSGLGFGITEAVLSYAPWAGNPAIESNVIRWFACVPMHAIYTVVDAAILWLLIPAFKNAKGSSATGILLAAALAIAVVHGAYNTLSGLHVLVGIILDGAAILLMVVIVRHCTARDHSNNGGANQIEMSIPRLPEWLQAKSDCSPAYGRLYLVAGALLLISILFSSSAPRLSSPAVSSFAEEVKAELGIELDAEAAIVYAMGYEIGSKANRPVPPGAFERIVRQAFAMNPGAHPALEGLMLLGIEDGYGHRPSRLK